MPARPIPPWMRWQVEQLPPVITNLRRPFYLRPSNNQPGGQFARAPRTQKPAPLVHMPKQTRAQALSVGSIGTAVGGPTTSSYLKVTDLPPGAVPTAGLAASGPSLGSAPTNAVRPFQKDTDSH